VDEQPARKSMEKRIASQRTVFLFMGSFSFAG